MRTMINSILFGCLLALLSIGLVQCKGGGGSSSTQPPASDPAPQVTAVDPTANVSDASTAATIFATFDQTMNVAIGSTFVTHGSKTGKLAGTFGGGGTNTLSFDSASAFKVGEEIEVTLTTGITSAAGVALDPPIVYRFRAEVMGGSNVFGSFLSSPVGVGNTPQTATVGDLDGDADLDLAVTTAGSLVRVLFNDGSGAFLTFNEVMGVVGPVSIVAGDLDGDGDLDLAVGNSGATNVSILINDGTGVFTQPAPPTSPVEVGNTPQTVTVGDLDGDGALDLAVTTAGSRVRVLFNNGSAVFPIFNQVTTGLVGPRSMIVGDWDGDGDLDLAVGNSAATNVSILINDGTGGFTQPAIPISPVDVNGTPQSNPQSMTAGDLDGDGDLDLAVARTDTNVALLENTP